MILSPEAQVQRLENRYKHWQKDMKEKAISSLTKADRITVDPVGKNEENVADVVITPDMDSNDVVEKILEAVKMFE